MAWITAATWLDIVVYVVLESLRGYKFPVVRHVINSQLLRNVIYCKSSVIQYEHINWIYHLWRVRHCRPFSPVFILNTISTFFKQFSPFVIFFIKTFFSVHITYLVNFTWFSLLCHQKFDVQVWCTLIFSYFELLQNKYISEIEIIFAINQFRPMNLWKNSENKLFCNKITIFTELHLNLYLSIYIFSWPFTSCRLGQLQMCIHV